jgi:hypothetical protein
VRQGAYGVGPFWGRPGNRGREWYTRWLDGASFAGLRGAEGLRRASGFRRWRLGLPPLGLPPLGLPPVGLPPVGLPPLALPRVAAARATATAVGLALGYRGDGAVRCLTAS